jgi:ADP-L-glycero-D-manno-heptose 6-epimerase
MIIVTGAAGFIGSNIVADLNAAGRTDLILVDELGTQSKWKNIAKRRFQDFVLPSELHSLLGKLSGGDLVFHLGANSSTTATDGDAVLLNNFRTSKDLWEWCVATKTPLIYASSAATYGDGALGFADDQRLEALDALRPLNLYGWSKHAFDKWAVERSTAGSAPPQWCGLKFFNVYGPNENHKGDMRSLVSKNTAIVSQGGTIKLFKSHRPDFEDGQQLRDFVYVKDCTSVMLWLAQADCRAAKLFFPNETSVICKQKSGYKNDTVHRAAHDNEPSQGHMAVASRVSQPMTRGRGMLNAYRECRCEQYRIENESGKLKPREKLHSKPDKRHHSERYERQ